VGKRPTKTIPNKVNLKYIFTVVVSLRCRAPAPVQLHPPRPPMDLHDAAVRAVESHTDVELLALVVAQDLEPVAQPNRGRRGAPAVHQRANVRI
jgi:hypothetical protein